MLDPNEWRRWLAQADYDFTAAQHLHAGGFFAVACFQAQQVAEKALKAYLYAQGERTVLSHSVSELCSRSAAVNAAFTPLLADARRLDRLYIPTRYPDGLPGGVPAESYDSDDSEIALGAAQKIVGVVRSLLPQD